MSIRKKPAISPAINDPWILVLGGVTQEGSHRAQRAICAAHHSGYDVVWFDGYVESNERSRTRETQDSSESAGIIVIRYAERERNLLVNRIVTFLPSLIVAPIAWLARTLRRPKVLGAIVVKLYRVVERGSQILREKVLRRCSNFCRGYFGWRLTRAPIYRVVRENPSPRAIVYGDDYALTQAWHVSRLIPDVEVVMELDLG